MMYGYGNMISPSNRLFSGSGASPLWNGLLAYYTADNTPNDALGNYNGTLVNGATYGTGIINQGFSLDGINDVVDMGNVLDFDGSTPFSISCWVKPNSLAASIFLGKSFAGPPYTGYTMVISGSKFIVSLANSYSPDNALKVQNSLSLSISTWYNVIFTYDGSKTATGLNLYVNNSINTKTILNDNLTGSISSVNPFRIGARNTQFYYNGIVDEIGIWNRELTPSEVTELYNSGAGKQY